MPANIDKMLGSLPGNLALFSQRSDVLASNIANADTPGYKARDIDFRSVLAKAGGDTLSPVTTNPAHLSLDGAGPGDAQTLYRVPLQPALDGNTVDAHVEQSEYAQNAVRYQSTLTFLNGRFKTLMLAIKGE